MVLKYLLFLCIVLVFGSSYWLHFFKHKQSAIMVVYTGHAHPRLFEIAFSHQNVDLFVFKHRRFRSRRVQFVVHCTPMEYFLQSSYQHLLLVHLLHPPVPLFYDTTMDINYMHANETVATLRHKPLTKLFETLHL
jgi:hypothetical protein